jgi:pimeloyl-ACP methyl ester carboxylesterase
MGMQHTEGFAIADGHQLRYRFLNVSPETGDAPLLVFLHEGLGSIRQWRDFPEELCLLASCPGLVYDRYGYGMSDPLEEERDSGYLERGGAYELPALLAALNITRPVVLFGHSDGGSVALVCAAEHPQLVAGVITEAAHVFLEELSIQGIRNTIEVYRQGKLKPLLEKYHGLRTESMFYGWAATWTSERFRDWSLEGYLPSIKAPVLAIQGLDDEYGTPEQVQAIVSMVSGPSEAFLIPSCGHVPHFQKRKEVLEKVRIFLQGAVKGR